ncbi:Bacteriophage Gp15 protein [Lysinibacillus capsici]|uniref:Bacteriophage Gp15 protein n=1 Tax=Lysinibacillus capsici TaxID=2115968 RepID=A0A2X0XXG5_9BACI|nr:Gp15 family bacteriophage protein [Lysinibacillus capsici]SPT98428.1 Bacteriophage Gp15 protein [Lysinibacillus capsici]
MELTDRRLDVYTWNGVDIELNLSFDNVLKLFDLFSDDINQDIKLDIALEMLVVNADFLRQLSGSHVAIRLVLDVLKDKLNIDLESDDITSDEEPQIPIYDFKEDAERIYASFLFDYNLDLFELQGKLQWHKFIALFENLSTDSPMGQAMMYRSCEVPKKDKYNADERKRIIAMKKKYELKVAKAIREQQELERVQKSFEMMKRVAKRKG